MKENARKFEVKMTVYVSATNGVADEEQVLEVITSKFYENGFLYDCEVNEIMEGK